MDTGIRDDQRRVVRLQHPLGACDVRAVASPELCESVADRLAATRLHAATFHEHRAVIEQEVKRRTIAQQERVLEEGFQLLGGSGS